MSSLLERVPWLVFVYNMQVIPPNIIRIIASTSYFVKDSFRIATDNIVLKIIVKALLLEIRRRVP